MSSLDTIPSVLGTRPAALKSEFEPDSRRPVSLWIRGLVWAGVGVLVWACARLLLK